MIIITSYSRQILYLETRNRLILISETCHNCTLNVVVKVQTTSKGDTPSCSSGYSLLHTCPHRRQVAVPTWRPHDHVPSNYYFIYWLITLCIGRDGWVQVESRHSGTLRAEQMAFTDITLSAELVRSLVVQRCSQQAERDCVMCPPGGATSLVCFGVCDVGDSLGIVNKVTSTSYIKIIMY